MKDFIKLGLASPLLNALAKQGYKKPTPIQIQAIPPALEGKDILGTAQTGTGKTAAFTLPILQQLLPVLKDKNKRPIRVLILTPTRELALQIHDSITHYGSQMEVFHTVIFGGVGQKPQTDALRRGVDIITATPGRLLDLMNQGHVNLSRLEHFVLDEADRMLDMGFIHDVKKIVAKLPRKRQTLFFSATMPKSVSALAGELLYKPVNVSVTAQATTVDRIDQSVIFTPQNHKLLQLVNLLSHDSVTSAIVFTRTKHRANRVSLALNKAGISSEPIHGNKSQGARQRALGAFKAGDIKALVATDIAARGIDVDAVSHVINFELPNVSEDYVHRIGRTARAGASGNAISLCAPDERAYLKSIEKLIKLSISVVKGIEVRDEDVPLPEPRGPRPPRRSNRPGGGRGFRGAKLSGEKGGRRKSDGQKQKPASAVGQKKRPAGSGNAGGRRRSQVPKTA